MEESPVTANQTTAISALEPDVAKTQPLEDMQLDSMGKGTCGMKAKQVNSKHARLNLVNNSCAWTKGVRYELELDTCIVGKCGGTDKLDIAKEPKVEDCDQITTSPDKGGRQHKQSESNAECTRKECDSKEIIPDMNRERHDHLTEVTGKQTGEDSEQYQKHPLEGPGDPITVAEDQNALDGIHNRNYCSQDRKHEGIKPVVVSDTFSNIRTSLHYEQEKELRKPTDVDAENIENQNRKGEALVGIQICPMGKQPTTSGKCENIPLNSPSQERNDQSVGDTAERGAEFVNKTDDTSFDDHNFKGPFAKSSNLCNKFIRHARNPFGKNKQTVEKADGQTGQITLQAEDKLHVCGICSKEFKGKMKLIAHMFSHMGSGARDIPQQKSEICKSKSATVTWSKEDAESNELTDYSSPSNAQVPAMNKSSDIEADENTNKQAAEELEQLNSSSQKEGKDKHEDATEEIEQMDIASQTNGNDEEANEEIEQMDITSQMEGNDGNKDAEEVYEQLDRSPQMERNGTNVEVVEQPEQLDTDSQMKTTPDKDKKLSQKEGNDNNQTVKEIISSQMDTHDKNKEVAEVFRQNITSQRETTDENKESVEGLEQIDISPQACGNYFSQGKREKQRKQLDELFHPEGIDQTEDKASQNENVDEQSENYNDQMLSQREKFEAHFDRCELRSGLSNSNDCNKKDPNPQSKRKTSQCSTKTNRPKNLMLCCVVCGKRFTCFSHWSAHLLSHTDQFLYWCEICGKGFKQRSNKNTHMVVHTNERPYNCDTCGGSFKNRYALVTHIKTHVEDLLKCDHCKTYHKSKHRLASHMRNVHGVRNHKCPHCNKGFTTKGHLLEHAKVHTKEKAFECKICHKRLGTNGYLKKHILLHKGEKPFKCTICNYASNEPGNLRRHMNIHSNNKYTCQYCSKTLTNLDSFRSHVRFKHTNPEAKYQCDLCQKSYDSKQRFDYHMSRHFGDRNVSCDVCGKSFRNKLDLKCHIKYHWQEKDKVCEICGRSFARMFSLRRHVKDVHSKKPRKS